MLNKKYIYNFEDFVNENIKYTHIEKGSWVEITSNKNGLVYLGRVIENYNTNKLNSKFLILDCENDYRLVESNNIKVCKMEKNLEFNINKNTSPIIS